jgi:hypothetical protein
MLVLSLVSLAIASISTFIFLNVQEDVIRPCFAVTAALALLLTLCLAPWAHPSGHSDYLRTPLRWGCLGRLRKRLHS